MPAAAAGLPLSTLRTTTPMGAGGLGQGGAFECRVDVTGFDRGGRGDLGWRTDERLHVALPAAAQQPDVHRVADAQQADRIAHVRRHLTGARLIETITSPTANPACSAAEPSRTCVTSAPSAPLRPSACAMSGVTGEVFEPEQPAFDRAELHQLVGDAADHVDRDREADADVAAGAGQESGGSPTSSPRRFTSAPPELPGLMAASVWMKSSSPS